MNRHSIHLLLAGALTLATAHAQEKLAVCVTTPDLGSIAREVGGDEATVTVLARGTEDAHFVVVRPSVLLTMHDAALYVETGLDLEIGWAPALLRKARNAEIQLGRPGYLDASIGIRPLNVPTGTIDRSMGDVHPRGNPHYLLDPVNGLHVAKTMCERMAQLRPTARATFTRNYEAFRRKIGVAMFGEKLFELYPFEQLAILHERGGLVPFLEKQNDRDKLGGWIGRMLPFAGTKIVGEHDLWRYFAQRFGLVVFDHLEPKPGVPPTTKHLGDVVRRMQSEKVRVILTVPYFDTRHARFVAEATGAVVVPMAHQVGARSGIDDYFAMVDYDVTKLAQALESLAEKQ